MTELVRAKEGFGLGLPATDEDKQALAAEAKAVKALTKAQDELRKAKASEITTAEAQMLIDRVEAAQADLATVRRQRIRKGRATMIKRGEHYSADHPAVVAFPEKFDDSVEWVERATAKPGEMRVNKPRTYDTIIKPKE